ncbi:hypothetical protein J3R82DRAFT_4586 [Butyriboletus roseoflavus]|nr:hypothetical protein J3R82DRAFT_4586 [Butyriboletus roseoflavus]
MAPVTRSSAPSTPARPRVSTGSDDLVTPPASGSRRTPHCTKCHRPRAGHPRSGCPYIDASYPSPISPSASRSVSSAAQFAPAADDGVLEELSSLHIVSPTKESRRASMPRTGKTLQRKLSVRFALVPEQTLASLSPTDSHLVEQLLQPGMISNAVSPQDRVAHVLEWRRTLDGTDLLDGRRKEEPTEVKTESLSDNRTSPLSRRMPCTLYTPTASLIVTEPVTDQGIGGSALNMNETVYLLPDADTRKTKPLSRSMSFEQRSLFLQQLSHSSSTAPATLVSLPLADFDNVRRDAENIGFHVLVLPSREDNDNKWVVLGTEEEAIDLLAKKFLEEEKRSTRVEGKGGKLTAVAGGVVFGAVATWTGLAFS